VIPPKVRAVVDERDEQVCVCCAQRATDRHHRRFKGMGGSSLPDTDTAPNLVTLCGLGNTSGCHGRAHSDQQWALANGYRVPQGADPLTIPITHHAWGVVWLTTDGGFNLDPQEVPA